MKPIRCIRVFFATLVILFLPLTAQAQLITDCTFRFDTVYWVVCAEENGVSLGCNVQTTEEISGVDCTSISYQSSGPLGGGGGGSGGGGSPLSNTDHDNDGKTDCWKDLTFDPNMTVSSSFGPRQHPVTGVFTPHNGTDFPVPTGTGIRATQDGVIADIEDSFAVGTGTDNGNFVRVDYDDGTQGVYIHLDDVYVARGDRVVIGQGLGTSNNTGTSTGPHLHYTIWKTHNHTGSASDLNNFLNPEQEHGNCSTPTP